MENLLGKFIKGVLCFQISYRTIILNYGAENLLEVTVSKHSENQSVNEATGVKRRFWIFYGWNFSSSLYIEVCLLSMLLVFLLMQLMVT